MTWLVAGFVILNAARVIPFFTARLWLPNHRSVRTADVHSDIPISDTHAEAVAEAVSRLEAHEAWLGPERSTRVLLISNARTYGILARLVGLSSESQGLSLGRTAVISLSFLESMRARWGPAYAGTILDGDLAHLVGHEMAHMALMTRLGRRTVVRLARWKGEGLAEYYSSDPDAVPSTPELARRVRDFLGPNAPRAGAIRGQYIEASLLVSYLTAVEGWTVDRIVDGPEDSTELVAEMKAWAGARTYRVPSVRESATVARTAAKRTSGSHRTL